MAPHRQCALEKPLTHSELLEDAQELTELESILEDQDVNKRFTEEKITNEQNTVHQEQARISEAVQVVSQKLNAIVTQTKFQVVLQEETSVNLRKNQGGSDTQTIKSILKINQTKSQKSVHRPKQVAIQKKVSFEVRLLRHKNNKLFM
ncbi:unnamed protein product (macronuclear) [Paramecium tetraurelia]|uniref:Uncharacterized protein n=1 Tax=Paramecium tetraurelia TaxID=5888 RepID=A0BXK2_PARTE|nr:uncharacterized protein GSPATT00033122001 [Paramecium tetraurelia]CAK63269.1 unnamed protein product [Paramecium tetraurelia]|eukprot:XP_001430667.1 hypothetical protein (macronuclear) [Paramecium tetraurelia strain d4-2]